VRCSTPFGSTGLISPPRSSRRRTPHRLKIEREPIERYPEYQEWEARLLKHLEPEVNRFVSRPPTCAELASKLPADGLLIEFWRCTWPDNQGSVAASYVASVLPENRPDLAKVIHLCECAALEDTLLEYLAVLSGRSKTAEVANAARDKRDPLRARELGHTLRTLLLDPLEPWTGRVAHLLLVTDGLLSRLPFSTLPLGNVGYVMDRWLVSYLHTARDLFPSDDRSKPSGSPLVISDPAYDWPGPFGQSSSRNFRVDRLEWAAREGEAIGRFLGVTPLTNTDATRAALMMCQSPEILHIATHGMLLPARPSVADLGPVNPLVWRDAGEMRFQLAGLATFAEGLGRLSERQLPDQALRSILALAGVNTWLDGFPVPDAAGNGLVSAEDIAALELAGNRLTMLSACETGLGVIGIGEGVLGLRSSFTIAGAETLVVSLWAVDDKSTSELMYAFYQNLIERRMGRAEALQQAQKTIRHQHPDDPYYWGSFISQGAVGPLSR
jgi:CHAT domain-containing protein